MIVALKFVQVKIQLIKIFFGITSSLKEPWLRVPELTDNFVWHELIGAAGLKGNDLTV